MTSATSRSRNSKPASRRAWGTRLTEPRSSGARGPAPSRTRHRGHGEERRPTQSVRQGLRELGVGGGLRAAEVERPAGVGVLGEMDDGGEPVAQRHHREVLPAVADLAAEAQAEEPAQQGQGLRLAVHHRRCPQDAHPRTRIDRRPRRCLPHAGHLGHQGVPAAVAGLGDLTVAVVAVDRDRVAGQEGRLAVRGGDRVCEGAGGRHPRLTQVAGPLLRVGVADRRASGEVDDDVGLLDEPGVDPPGRRVPLTTRRLTAGCAPDQRGRRVTLCSQRLEQVAPRNPEAPPTTRCIRSRTGRLRAAP